MRYAPCSTFRMSIKGGSTTCPTVLGSPRSHTACRRFAPLILPNWRASSRRAGSAVTEQPAALLLRSSNPDLDAAAAATVPTGPPHGRYQQGATQRSAAPWCPTCATHALPANSTSEHLLRPSPPCWRWMASKNRPRIAVAGFAAARWYLDTPEIRCRYAFNAMFPINCVAASSPDYSVKLPHHPAERAHCDCTSQAPCTTNRLTPPHVPLRHRFSP